MGVSDCRFCVGEYEITYAAIRATVEVQAGKAVLFALRENGLSDRPVVGCHVVSEVMLTLRGYYGDRVCAVRKDPDRYSRRSMIS